MKALYEDRPGATSGQQIARYGNLYLHIALGIYIGGIALIGTFTIISLFLGSLLLNAQEQALKSQWEHMQRNMSFFPPPNVSGVNVSRSGNVATIEAGREQAQLRCAGYKNRADFLARNLENGKLVDNYGSPTPMREEMEALLTTLSTDCVR